MRKAILAALLLCSCDVDPTTGTVEPVCDICVNEKTCPDGLCDTSAYEACVAAKVLAGMCEPLTSVD